MLTIKMGNATKESFAAMLFFKSSFGNFNMGLFGISATCFKIFGHNMS